MNITMEKILEALLLRGDTPEEVAERLGVKMEEGSDDNH